MKYRGVAAGLILLGAFVLHIPSAFAHFPATDKTMTVILHIDPDDQPVANQPAHFNFIYEDQLGRFATQDCDCRVAVYEHGQQLSSGISASQSGSTVYGDNVPYIFKNADVYAITLSGTPTKGGDFAPFKVSWDIRVTADPNSRPGDEKYYSIGFVGLMLIGASAMGYFIYHDFKDV